MYVGQISVHVRALGGVVIDEGEGGEGHIEVPREPPERVCLGAPRRNPEHRLQDMLPHFEHEPTALEFAQCRLDEGALVARAQAHERSSLCHDLQPLVQCQVVCLQHKALGSDLRNCVAPESIVAIDGNHLDGGRADLGVQAPRRCGSNGTLNLVGKGNMSEPVCDGVKQFAVNVRFQLCR